MAWKPKKPVVLSPEERAYVQKKLEDYKNKFFKPIKGEFIYKIEGFPEEIAATARYFTEEDLKNDAEETVARMNAKDKKHI